MISKSEASDALREAERVHRRTTQGSTYSKASPHLVLAGVLWTMGYVATGLAPPEQWIRIWAPIALLGPLISFGIAYFDRRPATNDPAEGVIRASRLLWSIVASMAFMSATFLLFHTNEKLPYLAFPPLLMALLYVMAGSYGLPRFRWIGVGIFAIIETGLLIGQDSMAFWAAAAGGGGLILGGLWLRKA